MGLADVAVVTVFNESPEISGVLRVILILSKLFSFDVPTEIVFEDEAKPELSFLISALDGYVVLTVFRVN